MQQSPWEQPIKVCRQGLNLCLNLIMVQFWGIYGILLSTVLSMLLVGMPWLLKNLFSTIFEKQMLGQYLIPLGKYIGATGAVVVVSICICTLLRPSGIAAIVVNALISGGITLIVFYLLFRKSEEFKRAIGIIDRVTRGKFKLNKRIK